MKTNLKNKIKIAVLTLLVAAPAAFANPVYTIYGNATGAATGYISTSGAHSCTYGPTYGTTSCQIDNSGQVPSTYTDQYGNQVAWPDYGGTSTSFLANLSSSGDAAGLHSSVSLQVVNDPYVPGFTGSYYDNLSLGNGNGTATAEAQDSWTPAPPAGWTGGPFYIAVTIQADGDMSQTYSPGASDIATVAYGEMDFSLNGYTSGFQFPSNTTQPGTGYTFNDTVTTAPTEVTSLNPLDYTFTLETLASVACTTSPNLGDCSATSTAQMSNTATITGIEFEDANGNPIPGFTIDSGSGTDYDSLITSNDSTAPEPGTIWMLAAGLALLAAGSLRGAR